MILTGIGAVRAKAGAAIRSLAERVGCPVVVSPKAKGVVAADHPYFAGTIDMACNQVVWDFLKSCDLVIAIGFDAVELIKTWEVKAPVIHIDSTPNVDQVYPASIELVGSISAIVDELSQTYKGEARWAEPRDCRPPHQAPRRLLCRQSRRQAQPDRRGRHGPGAVPRDTIATTDVGSHKLLVGQGWAASEPLTLLMTNGLSSMGFALPAAITAKLLHPERPVVCFTGDGGLAMVQSELHLAASLRLGIVVVVFCDNSLNRIELKQMALNYPSWGTRLESMDVVKVAEGMGCDGVRVDQVPSSRAALEGWNGGTRPLVIEAHIDPQQYVAQF